LHNIRKIFLKLSFPPANGVSDRLKGKVIAIKSMTGSSPSYPAQEPSTPRGTILIAAALLTADVEAESQVRSLKKP
jgi:hypothetical protein